MDAPKDCFIVDNDGVLRRESAVMHGVPEFFAALEREKIRSVLLSNSARSTADMLRSMLGRFGVDSAHMPDVLGSSEATALHLLDHASPDMRVFVAGPDALCTELKAKGIALANDDWTGKTWKQRPTDVVVGFDEAMAYETLAPAYNALRYGSRLTATNADAEYRNEAGEILPANGANVRYLSGAGRKPVIVGKPGIAMAEIALHRMRADKQGSRITVIGDTVEQDIALGDNLRRAGWNVRRWLVLTGLNDLAQGQEAKADAVFHDIDHVRRHLTHAEPAVWSAS